MSRELNKIKQCVTKAREGTYVSFMSLFTMNSAFIMSPSLYTCTPHTLQSSLLAQRVRVSVIRKNKG